MNELYSETYVESRPSVNRILARSALIALCFILPFTTLFVMKSLLFTLVAIAADGIIIFFLPTMHIAYEYVFVDGQIDFDCIYNGSKRKTIRKIDMEQVDVVAPEGSHALDSFTKMPLVDCSSTLPTDKHYVLAGKSGKGNVRIKFTPNEKMLEQMMMKGKSKFAK